jgi:hypothetical protein
MIARRKVMGGSLLAAAGALLMAKPAAGAEQGATGDQKVADAIEALREEFVKSQECSLGPCSAIASIRFQQNVFLKANQKFPDFIDAGFEVWEAVYDWHVRNRQPIVTTRLPDGRHGIVFMFTTIVLRPENTPNFLSLGYDAR